MRRMKIYIAGPMRGYEDLNRPAFLKAQETLEAMGHEVFNPGNNPRETLRLCMEIDLAWICRHADGMVMLLDWGMSSGVAAELATAKALDIPIWYQVARDRSRFINYGRFRSTGEKMYPYLSKVDQPLIGSTLR